MKKNELQELRNKTYADLRKYLRDKRSKLSNLRFDLALGKVKNITDIRSLKKDIAQLMTLMRESKKS